MDSIIKPSWPAPSRVKAFTTTRDGGVSLPPFDSFNLADHVGDQPQAVCENRRRLLSSLNEVQCVAWLNQVHGADLIKLDETELASSNPTADGVTTRQPDQVCLVQTADCLPILLCDVQGRQVGAVHAGWRGLLRGILANGVAAFNCAPDELMAWLGPAIGPSAFEVGLDVYNGFKQADPAYAAAFAESGKNKWHADIYQIARLQLNSLGVHSIYGGDYCTFTQSERFFSYRRDGLCGRMVSLIYLAA